VTWVLAQTAPEASWPAAGDLTRSLVAIFVVFGLLALLAWLARRGTFGALGRQGRALMKVESAVPLGDRRSLMIVTVEGRRLLLGLTPMQVSLVTELAPAPSGPGETPFEQTLARTMSGASPS
jgi:flagellar biosynthetic protein FliO